MLTVFAFMDYITMLLWTFDFDHVFSVGSYDNGSLETLPDKMHAGISRLGFLLMQPS